MDAVLILDGGIPSVDFNSRQPIYAYVNAVGLKLLGIDYISGRLLPMTFSLLVGVMVFFIANALFERRVAILSAAIYWMLPLELINSVVVKTEPLTILLTCLSLYAVILFSQSDKKVWLVVAGIFAAMGFYVRQSALIIPLTVFGYLWICHTRRFRDILKYFGFFLMGYAGVLLLALIYFTRFMGVEDFLMGDLSPLGFLASAGRKLPSLFGFSVDSANDIASRAPDISNKNYNLYYNYVRQALNLHSFLIIGFLFSIIVFGRRVLSGNKPQIKRYQNSHSLLYLWVFSLLLAYAYYYYTKVFYIDYFREFLPPLVIIFAAWLCHAAPALNRDEILERFVIGGFCIAVVIFFMVPHFKEIIGQGVMIGLTLALFTMVYFAGDFESRSRKFVFLFTLTALAVIILFSRQGQLAPYLSGKVAKLAIILIIFIIPWMFLAKSVRPTIKGYLRFLSFSLVLGAMVLSLTYSASRLTLAYDSNWSPLALKKTSAYLRDNTQSNDTVMSGAVIWELQALRKPFLGISHPLSLEGRISEKERERLEAEIKANPPEVIILDSFTEKTYFRQVPRLRDFISLRYELVYTAEPARHPVQVYRQKGIIPANPNASAETKALLQYLRSLSSRSDKKVLSGQFVARESAYENDVIGLYNQTGYWPALLGIDYYHETWEKDPKYDNMNRLAIDYWNKKGLVTINIHPSNPQTGGKARDGRINLEDVLTPGTASNIAWTRQLKLIANGLDELQDAGVVVLWRPFHEMCGGWWWGMNSDEPPSLFYCLWKQMFDYFTYDRQLNNLLWVYTSGECFDTYYPGDDYVDINGADYYGNEPWLAEFQQNIQISISAKPFALTEFGPVSWKTDTVMSSPKFDFNILLDAIKNNLIETIWFLEWHGVWSMAEHLNAEDLLSDPIIINRGDIAYFD